MNKVVLITGASRGIGAVTARLLAQPGHAIVINFAQDAAAASQVAKSVEAAGGQALLVQADVADEAQVMAMFGQIDRQFGRLDALVNNAGVVAPSARLDQMDMARWRRMFDINVLGSLLCAREAVRRMSQRHGGSGGAIVNVSSAAARLGSPGEYIDYAASKGAIDSLTLGLSKEVGGEGIRVNAVRPGLINTEIHASGGRPDRVQQLAQHVPMQRGGQAEEVAHTIVWLLSDAASYVNGALLDVSGGR